MSEEGTSPLQLFQFDVFISHFETPTPLRLFVEVGMMAKKLCKRVALWTQFHLGFIDCKRLCISYI
jgi:hypothetical protein